MALTCPSSEVPAPNAMMGIPCVALIRTIVAAGAALAAAPVDLGALQERKGPERPAAKRPPLLTLRQRFPDLRRHFVFEYYPWYRTNPFGHWNEAERQPPIDLASNYMPV